MQRRLSALPIAALVLGPIVLGACGSSSGGESATSLISKSQSAIAGASALHYVQVITLRGQTQSVTGSVSATQADVVSLVNKSPLLELRLVGTTLYFVSQSVSILEKNFTMSASVAKNWTGRWISILPSDSVYSSLISTLSVGAEVTSLYPAGSNITINEHATIRGRATISVTGHSSTKSSSSESTIFLDPGTYFPVAATAIGRTASQTEHLAVVMSHWNQAFSVTAPSGATPLSSI